LHGEDTRAKEQPPAATQGNTAAGDTGLPRHVRRDHPSGKLRDIGAAPKQRDTQIQAPREDFGWPQHGCAHRLIGSRYMQRPARRPAGAVHDGTALSRTNSARSLALQLIGPDGEVDLRPLEQAAGLNNDPAPSPSVVPHDHAARLKALLSNDHALLRAICSIF